MENKSREKKIVELTILVVFLLVIVLTGIWITIEEKTSHWIVAALGGGSILALIILKYYCLIMYANYVKGKSKEK